MDRRAIEEAPSGTGKTERSAALVQAKQLRPTTLIACLIGVAALYLAREVLIPFALAALVSFLLGPLVGTLQQWGLPRVLAVFSSLMLMLAGTGVVGWIVVGEMRDLAAKVPEYRTNIRQKTAVFRETLGKPFEQGRRAVRDLSTDLAPPAEAKASPREVATVHLAEPARDPLGTIGEALHPVLGWLTIAGMVLFFSVVMLLRPDDIRDRLIRLGGSGQIYTTTQALGEASGKVSAYLARQLFINGLLGTGAGVCLFFIGVPNALLWGLLFTILRFVPYVGAWIAAGLPILLSFAISDGWLQPIQTVAAYVVLELVGNFFLEPWIYGAGTGISPLAILASTLFWSWLWGPIGLVLATPMTVCLVVMGKYVPRLHFLYLLCSDTPALPPATRLYQRLIAQDQDGAWSVLKADLAERPLRDVLDSIVLPAVCMAEHDRQLGTLDEDASTQLHENIQLLLDESEDAYVPANEGDEAAISPAIRGLRVLCVPARSAADEVAAVVLARTLERGGALVRVNPRATLLGETVKDLASNPVDVVFVSAVPPSRFLHVRYVCKRLTERFPDLEIVVGMWMWQSDSPEPEERIPKGEHIHLVTTLAAAEVQLRRLAGERRTNLAPTPQAAATDSRV